MMGGDHFWRLIILRKKSKIFFIKEESIMIFFKEQLILMGSLLRIFVGKLFFV